MFQHVVRTAKVWQVGGGCTLNPQPSHSDILIFVVLKAAMKDVSHLPYTATEMEQTGRKPELIIYTCSELGFDPEPVTAGLFASNLS